MRWCVVICVVGAGATLGCVGLRSATPPAWTDAGKPEDSYYVYRTGSGQGATEAAARQAAIQDAVDQHVRALLPASADFAAIPLDLIQDIQPVPQGIWSRREETRIAVHVLTAWPKSTRQRVVANLEDRGRCVRDWQEATGGLKGDPAMAIPLLARINAEYPRYRSLPFARAEVDVALGDQHWRGMGNAVAAELAFRRVLDDPMASADWKRIAHERMTKLPDVPMRPLVTRWQGGPVGLLTLSRRGSERPQRLAALFAQLESQCRLAGIPVSDLAGLNPDATWASVFDAVTPPAIPVTAAPSPRVVLAVLVDTDPALAGRSQEIEGVAMPVLDTTVRLAVWIVNGRAPLYSCTFKGLPAGSGMDRQAEYVASIAVRNYLVRFCPPLQTDRLASD